MPPYLASPSALTYAEVGPDEYLWLSKLDGEAFFDQLKLNPELVPYMGRPPVSVDDLVGVGGLNMDEIQSFVVDGTTVRSGLVLVPVNLTWSMGISWSSAVAQSTMTHAVLQAGYRPSSFLTEEFALPADPRDTVAVATDDIGVLVVGADPAGHDRSVARARSIAAALFQLGIREKADKRLEGVLNGTLLGIQLVGGHRLQIPGSKMHSLIAAFLDMTSLAEVAPGELHSLQASCQWYCLLRRGLLSCFDRIYDFVQKEPTTCPVALPSEVIDELSLCIALSPLWSVDLRSEWLDQLIATDASDVFGFGVCSTPCSPALARQVGAQCSRRGDHVRFQQEPGDDPEKPRLGTAFRLPFGMSRFKTLASRRAQYVDHSGGLEATALGLGLDLLSRRLSTHGKRVAVLVDAQAVLYAAEKGRSSAPTLRRPLRRIAALTLACGWLPHFAYVPSESNPADAPSRGLVAARERPRDKRRQNARRTGASAVRAPTYLD